MDFYVEPRNTFGLGGYRNVELRRLNKI